MNGDNMNKSLVRDFLSGYYHEDWIEETGSDEAVIELFFSSSLSSDFVARLASEMESLSIEMRSAKAHDDVLFREYGCYYTPSADGLTASEWLMKMSKTITDRCPKKDC